jgi:hypothetical protein
VFSLKMQYYIGPVCLTANVGSCVEWVAVNGVLVGGWFALGTGGWQGKMVGNLFLKKQVVLVLGEVETDR